MALKLATNKNIVSINIYYIQVFWDLHVPPDRGAVDSSVPNIFYDIIWYNKVKLMFVK